MMHQMTVERVTNRVWGIFTSLEQDHRANNEKRRELLKAHIVSLVERGERNGDRLTVDGLTYLKELSFPKKKSIKQRAFKSR
jgi:hypothetical protein